jgi:hypothetical protein
MLAEVRFYRTGWVVRLGVLAIRWNRQDDYRALSIEWLGPWFAHAGGMTWAEFKQSRRQAAEAAKAARAVHVQ